MSDTIAVALITSLIGGFLVALVNQVFLKRKTDADAEKSHAEATKYLEEIKKIQAETEKTTLEIQNLKRLEQTTSVAIENAIENVAKETKDIARQGIYYPNSTRAFAAMAERIEEEVTNKSHPRVDLKLIAVAMTYSWDGFITISIPALLGKGVSVNLEVVFVDPIFLRDLKLVNRGVDWAEKSALRMTEVIQFAELCEKFDGRFRFVAKTYRNLPHWHGWLVNDEHLFLGRTRWDFADGHKVLTVGQNEYRYFDTSIKEGQERIELFLQWFKYYSKFPYENIVSSG
jgi:Cu/Ag efflux protein CusF